MVILNGLNALLDYIDELPAAFHAFTALVTALSYGTVGIPSRSHNPLADALLRLVALAAGNFGRNKNADDTTPGRESWEL